MSESRTHVVILAVAIVGGLWVLGPLLESSPDSSHRTRVESLNVATDGGDEIVREFLVGTVVDLLGKPLSGAEVRIGPHLTSTDALGHFRVPHVREVLRVNHSDCFELVWSATEHGHYRGKPCVLTLRRGVRIQGRTLNKRRIGLAGVEVLFYGDPDGGVQKTLSNHDGTWLSPLLEPGPVHVLWRHPKYLPLSSTAAPNDGLLNLGAQSLESGDAAWIQVVDGSGRSLADAQIWVDSIERGTTSTRYAGRTGDLGDLRIGVPSQRRVLIRARLPGYREATKDAVGAQTIIKLQPAPVLEAQTVTAHGLPSKPKSVVLERLADDGRFEVIPHRGVLFHTLRNGRIRIGLPDLAGSYRVAVTSGERLAGVSTPIQLDGRSQPTEVLLVPLQLDSSFSGYVVHRGRPVSGARVLLVESMNLAGASQLHGVRTPPSPRVLFRARTRADGRFSVSAVPQDPFRIVVEGRVQGRNISALVDPSGFMDKDFVVHVPDGRALEGRIQPITGVDGRIVSSVENLPVVLIEDEMPARETRSDANGAFRFLGVALGSRCKIAVGLEGATYGEARRFDQLVQQGSAMEVLHEEQSEPLVLKTWPETRGSLEVRVLVDGKPRAGRVRISSLSARGTNADRAVDTNAEGVATIHSLNEGEFRVSLTNLPASRYVRIKAGEISKVQLTVSTMSYTILVESKAGLPVAVGVAELSEVLASSTSTRKVRRKALTGSDIQFEDLFPGRYRLRITAPGFVDFDSQVRLDSTTRHRVPLDPGKAVRIHLKKPDGSPYSGDAEVEIRNGESLVLRERRRLVGGVLELPTLKAGEYQLTVRAETLVYKQALRIFTDTAESPAAPRRTQNHRAATN